MNYELAKNLKDAGYPQKFNKGNWAYLGIVKVMVDSPEINQFSEDMLLIPTLSELIEACGDKFDALSRLPAWAEGKWEAYYDTGSGIGYTPEEAVANLWLELHKNV